MEAGAAPDAPQRPLATRYCVHQTTTPSFRLWCFDPLPQFFFSGEPLLERVQVAPRAAEARPLTPAPAPHTTRRGTHTAEHQHQHQHQHQVQNTSTSTKQNTSTGTRKRDVSRPRARTRVRRLGLRRETAFGCVLRRAGVETRKRTARARGLHSALACSGHHTRRRGRPGYQGAHVGCQTSPSQLVPHVMMGPDWPDHHPPKHETTRPS